MNVKDLSFSELITLGVNHGLYPRYVYKYRALNENTIKIFTDKNLWFSKPNDFNDPFDCQIIVEANNTVDEIAAWLRQTDPTMTSKDVKRHSRHWAKNIHEWKKMINQTVSHNLNKSGICCFAGSADNILMWSHYGDSHKGICIKFDLLADVDFFNVPLKVNYDINYPKYNYIKDCSTIMESLVMTKAQCWQYEQEVRVFKRRFGLVPFRKEAITELIFGCNCSADDIKEIKKLIIGNGFDDIKFTKATKAKSAFKIELKDITY